MKQVINSLLFFLSLFILRNLVFIQTCPAYPTFGTRIHSAASIFVQFGHRIEGNCPGSLCLHLKEAERSIAEAEGSIAEAECIGERQPGKKVGAWWLKLKGPRELALPEDPSWIPNTHIGQNWKS